MKRKVRYLQTAPEMIETAQSGHLSGPGINWHRPQAGRKPDFSCVRNATMHVGQSGHSKASGSLRRMHQKDISKKLLGVLYRHCSNEKWTGTGIWRG